MHPPVVGTSLIRLTARGCLGSLQRVNGMVYRILFQHFPTFEPPAGEWDGGQRLVNLSGKALQFVVLHF